MDYNSYQDSSHIQKELILRKENFLEILKLFVMISEVEKLTYLKYDFKYNSYMYECTVNAEEEIDADIHLIDSRYSIVLKDKDIIFGKIVFDQKVSFSKASKSLVYKAIDSLKKIFEIEKELQYQNAPLNLYIVSDDKSSHFSSKLQTNLEMLLNANIDIINDLSSITNKLSLKNSKNIIIYAIADEELIAKNEDLLDLYNEFVIVIGPNNHSLSLKCGKLNILSYIAYDDFSPELVKKYILETKYKIQNKNKLNNKIISISGVCGGIGTTTIAMNVADILAHNRHEKNVLFIDLSTTKAISNLFLSQNPVPKHSIIDLLDAGDFNIEKNLEYGLVKVRENFYAINGIQKHIDKDLLDKEEFIEKFLDYILKSSESFNYIIIDVGVADASPIKSTIYDLANEIWVLTELAIPHVSTLKTFYSLMKRAGLKDKMSFIVNRVNSLNEISMNDFDSIMSTSISDDVLEYEKIPNDYETLGKCWNYCELASQLSKDSTFVNQITKILKNREYIEEDRVIQKQKKSLFSIFKKAK